MSAIIAGRKCKQCCEEYYMSFGHPEWYDDVMKRGKPKSSTFLRFEDMQKSGLCVQCFTYLEARAILKAEAKDENAKNKK